MIRSIWLLEVIVIPTDLYAKTPLLVFDVARRSVGFKRTNDDWRHQRLKGIQETIHPKNGSVGSSLALDL